MILYVCYLVLCAVWGWMVAEVYSHRPATKINQWVMMLFPHLMVFTFYMASNQAA